MSTQNAMQSTASESYSETSDLELKDQEVLPSGLSMLAVSEAKDISVQALATLVSVPIGNLEKFFNGNNEAIMEHSKSKISEFLGFNKQGKLSSEFVHFMRLEKLTGSKEMRFKKMRAIGSSLNASKAALVKLPFSIKDARSFFVVQNSEVRILFSGGIDLHFKLRSTDWQEGPAFIEDCKWAASTLSKSFVKITREDNTQRIRSMDITPIEFDNLFSEGKAATWADADVIARKAGVSAEEVIHWIETVGKNRTQGADVPPELRVVRSAGIGEIQKRM